MIFVRFICIVLLTVSLFNCSKPAEETAADRVPGNVPVSQPAAEDADLTISPSEATVRTVITLRTNKHAIRAGDVHWLVNGNRDAFSKGRSFSPDDVQKGDTVQAVIIDGNREYRSNEVTIKNTPPVFVKAEITPVMPRFDSTLTLNIEVNDVDNDAYSLKYRWTINGRFAGEEDHLETDLKRDDEIMVEVTPFDGDDYGKSIILKSRVFNSLPVLTENRSSFDGKTYSYQITASDPDNDKLAYTLHQGPKGMAVDPASGTVTWDIAPELEGVHEAQVLVSDNKGGTLLVPISTTVSFKDEKQQPRAE